MASVIHGLLLILPLAGAVAAADAPNLNVPPTSGARMTFSSDEALSVVCQPPQALQDDSGSLGIFAAALRGDAWFAKSGDGSWAPWDAAFSHLQPFADTGALQDGAVDLLRNSPLGAGEYLAYCAVGASGEALQWISAPTPFVVFAAGEAGLHAFEHRQTLDAYLKTAAANAAPEVVFAPGAALDQDSGDAPDRVSQTNLQESGVDEADIIKVHDNRLYALADCGDALSNRDCLRIFELQSAPPRAPQEAEISLPHEMPSVGLYLRDAGADGRAAQLISLASGGGWYAYPQLTLMADSLLPYYPVPSSTEVAIHDLAHPLSPETHTQITLDGELIASRRIGDILYLVTRYSDAPVFYPAAAEDVERAQEDAAQPALPGIVIDGQRSELFRADDCFLPPASATQFPQSTITSLLALPLDAPEAFKAVCITGPSEAVYASTQSVYLATTRYPYSLAADGAPDYVAQHQTDVHKFAFDGPGFAYRGSASFEGHLGWEQDKRSFRFGEHQGVLRVAASVGEAWNDSSSTRVVLFEENASQTALRQVGQLEHLGKPGERLYAARFLGERAYLVTFRVTDPLYVLDLADAENPRVAGELEIAGYSDYLHPIGDDYLLGVGKDAVPDTLSSDFGGARGAWYQGLKLALFDVSEPTQPVQLDARIIGKRGTQSALLYDHHALSYLPPDGQQPARIALPVELHEQTPSSSSFDAADPRSFYGWTHTGLYVFDLHTDDSPAISERLRIIAEQAPAEQQYGGRFGDRSVLQGDAVHYLHLGETYSDGL